MTFLRLADQQLFSQITAEMSWVLAFQSFAIRNFQSRLFANSTSVFELSHDKHVFKSLRSQYLFFFHNVLNEQTLYYFPISIDYTHFSCSLFSFILSSRFHIFHLNSGVDVQTNTSLYHRIKPLLLSLPLSTSFEFISYWIFNSSVMFSGHFFRFCLLHRTLFDFQSISTK